MTRSSTEGSINTIFIHFTYLCRIILETEPQEVLAKVAKAPGPSVKNLVDRPLDKQTLSSAFKLAKEGIRSLW